MKYNTALVDAIEFFFFDSLASFRSLEQKTKAATSFRNIFKEKNFLEIIIQLKELQDRAKRTNVFAEELINITSAEVALKNQLDLCLHLFQELLDDKIIINKCLEQKLHGDKSTKSKYKEYFLKAEKAKRELNIQIMRLDDLYSEYIQTPS